MGFPVAVPGVGVGLRRHGLDLGDGHERDETDEEQEQDGLGHAGHDPLQDLDLERVAGGG